jgi:hypothetical protein
MVGIRQKLRLYLVLLMMSAVFSALGYWTRVLREGAGRYDFRARPETPANTSGSGNQPEAAAPRDKPTQTSSQGASLIPPGHPVAGSSFAASK